MSHLKQQKINFITSRAMNIIRTVYYVHGQWGDEIIFVALNVSFNSGHYTVIIKRQFLYINILCWLVELGTTISVRALLVPHCQSSLFDHSSMTCRMKSARWRNTAAVRHLAISHRLLNHAASLLLQLLLLLTDIRWLELNRLASSRWGWSSVVRRRIRTKSNILLDTTCLLIRTYLSRYR